MVSMVTEVCLFTSRDKAAYVSQDMPSAFVSKILPLRDKSL